ncbi:uncharacterized protein [Dermacentor albipictus]|uniref:uncharacterized protein isoform X2 n=1 Tax=Dermacentor albipictus TaxID=60249 RepID=UPI0038FC269C
MELRSQSDAPALHKDATTTGRVLRHAAQQHDRCGLAQRSATASAQGYARSQPPCGRTIHGRHRGIFRIGGCHVSAFLWSGESCPRAFVDGTADRASSKISGETLGPGNWESLLCSRDTVNADLYSCEASCFIVMQRPQSNSSTSHQDTKMTGHGFRHAVHQEFTCGGTRRPATVSAHSYSRALLSGLYPKRGRRPGILPSRCCPVPAFLWSRHGWPGAFVSGGKHRQRVSPRRSGGGSAGTISATLLAASAAAKTMVHRRRIELAAGTVCHPRSSQPRVLENSAPRLTIAGALCRPCPSCSGGAWRKGGLSCFKCTYSFCVAGCARGDEGPAVMAFHALRFPAASRTGASKDGKFQFRVAKHSTAILPVAE